MSGTYCSICGAQLSPFIAFGSEFGVLMNEHIPKCRGPKEDEEGRKADVGKPRLDLLPPAAVMEIAKVLEFGARKYAPDNWRKVEGWRWRYTGAALRHLFAWMGGERADPESGIHHLAHAGCCVLFLLEKEITK